MRKTLWGFLGANLTFPGPTVPIELVEAIIDHLRSDRRSLKACSLVCKAWTHRARFNLFACLDLHAGVAKRILISESRVKMMPYIRHLCLIGSSYDPTKLHAWDEIVPMLNDFHNVRCLGLSGFDLESSTSPNCGVLASQFTHIVALHLIDVRSLSFDSFANVICAFPCLETLALCNVAWWTPTLPVQSLNLPRGLSAVQLMGYDNHTILTWLLSLDPIPALRTFYLYHTKSQDVAIAGDWLNALSSSLQSFACSSMRFDYDDGMSTPSVLSICSTAAEKKK